MIPPSDRLAEPVECVERAFTQTCFILAGTSSIPAFFIAEAYLAIEEECGRDTLIRLMTAILAPVAEEVLPPELENAARTLLCILYTGQVKTPEKAMQSRFYNSALAWQLLEFAGPPGLCSFGSWARKALS